MRFVDAYTHPDGVAYLWGILKERPAYANISHKRMPDLNEHRRYLASRPHPYWFLIVDDEVPAPGIVGSIYLSPKREIGVAILTEYRRKGYATDAIEKLREMFPGPMHANVAPGNAESHHLFGNVLHGKVMQTTYKLP